MRRPLPLFALLLSLCGLAGPSLGDDETVTALGVGPLRVSPLSDVRIASLEVHLSRERLQSTWEIVATGDRDATSVVAVPLPRLDAGTAGLDALVANRSGRADFVGVALDVDGRPLTPEVEVRASSLGLDVTERLKADGLPVDPWTVPDLEEKLAALPADGRRFYVDHGMAQWFDGGLGAWGWDVATTLWWTQTFAPGRPTRITLGHRPLAGTALVTEASIVRLAEDGRCLDGAGRAALSKALADNRPAGAAPGSSTALFDRRFVIPFDTGRGFQTIGAFRLVVEKPRPETLVFVCGATPAARPLNTTVFEAKNFSPQGDVTVHMIEPPEAKK